LELLQGAIAFNRAIPSILINPQNPTNKGPLKSNLKDYQAFCEKRQALLSLAEQIYHKFRILIGFDLGTQYSLFGKPKFVMLAYVMYNILVLLQRLTEESMINR